MQAPEASDIISPATARRWLLGTKRATEAGESIVLRAAEENSHLTAAAMFIAKGIVPKTLNQAYEVVNPNHPFTGETLVRTALGINSRYSDPSELDF